jgi:hypothetical protein
MRAVAAILSCALVIACSSSANDAATNDAGKDVGNPFDALADTGETIVDTAPPFTPCGAPPYFTLRVRARYLNISGESDTLPDVKVTIDLCPDVTLTTNASGEAVASVQRGAAFTTTFSATDHVTVIAAEDRVELDDTLEELHLGETLPLTNASSMLVGYSTTAPFMAVVIEPDGISGSPCNDPYNIHFAVPTGVTAHYMTPSWPPDTSEPITDASVGPVVFFEGLTGSETTIPEATTGGSEASCATLAQGPPTRQTGKVKLAPGAWSVANVARAAH